MVVARKMTEAEEVVDSDSSNLEMNDVPSVTYYQFAVP